MPDNTDDAEQIAIVRRVTVKECARRADLISRQPCEDYSRMTAWSIELARPAVPWPYSFWDSGHKYLQSVDGWRNADDETNEVDGWFVAIWGVHCSGRDRQWAVFERNDADRRLYHLKRVEPRSHSRVILDASWAPIVVLGRMFMTASRDRLATLRLISRSGPERIASATGPFDVAAKATFACDSAVTGHRYPPTSGAGRPATGHTRVRGWYAADASNLHGHGGGALEGNALAG
ncbi:MAG: hypothetical protein M1826_000036 [Phylliscum demangeonii]|nr:MAG: hypothetical protein M1826_000036 [Phylliscum demangeonii]